MGLITPALIDSSCVCEIVGAPCSVTSPVLGSIEKYGCPCRILYTILALFPYVGSSESLAVTCNTDVPGKKIRNSIRNKYADSKSR